MVPDIAAFVFTGDVVISSELPHAVWRADLPDSTNQQCVQHGKERNSGRLRAGAGDRKQVNLPSAPEQVSMTFGLFMQQFI